MGDSWIYGIVDENGRFTGEKNVAYIYQDLELAMVGKYTNGIFVSKKMQLQKKKRNSYLFSLQINGQEADIISQKCNEHGIKELEFSEPRGPMFYYLKPTNESFGDQPHLVDPISKKYVYLKDSEKFPLAGS